MTVVEEQIVYTFNELIADIGGGLGILKGPPLFNTKGPHFSAPKIPQFNKKKLLSSTHPSWGPSGQHQKLVSSTTPSVPHSPQINTKKPSVCLTEGFLVLSWGVCWPEGGVKLRRCWSEGFLMLKWGIFGAKTCGLVLNWRGLCGSEGY